MLNIYCVGHMKYASVKPSKDKKSETVLDDFIEIIK